MDNTIQRIAILRLSAIGDVCHAMAVVQAVQRQYPNAQVTWITSPLEAQVVRLLPNVDVHVYDKASGVSGMLQLRRALAEIKFDVLLHLQWSLRASSLSKMIRAKRRIGFAKAYSREKQHWFVNEYGQEPRGPHVLDSFLAVAAKLGIDDIQLPVELMLPSTPVYLPSRYVVINPSASKAERNWTVAGYLAVIDWLKARHIEVVLTGGPGQSERELAQQLEQDGVTNLVGQTKLPEMLVVLQQAELVVSPDTGPAHMATIVGTPVVGLYAHSNPRRTGPYQDLDKVVSVYEECAEREYGQPVESLPWASRVHDPKAMEYISSEQVINTLAALI